MNDVRVWKLRKKRCGGEGGGIVEGGERRECGR